MTTEECESELAERRSLRKRVKLDHERAESPRASAVQSAVKTSSAFLPKGSLDSQSTSQEAIDALIAARIRDDTTSQDFLDQLDYRRQPVLYNDDDISEELDDYEALHARCTQAEAERDEARGERNQALAELSSVQRAYDEMVVVKNCAEGQLACWKRAAISGLRCANSVEHRGVTAAFTAAKCRKVPLHRTCRCNLPLTAAECCRMDLYFGSRRHTQDLLELQLNGKQYLVLDSIY
ncbi:hypothetical protein B0H12DRAFT_1080899 [Mycena haematopus]|nr:hypothetical protein B0H12DRAFT_1080899 [Mycena haematopus]